MAVRYSVSLLFKITIKVLFPKDLIMIHPLLPIMYSTYAVPLYMVSKIIIFKILLLYIVPLRKS